MTTGRILCGACAALALTLASTGCNSHEPTQRASGDPPSAAADESSAAEPTQSQPAGESATEPDPGDAVAAFQQMDGRKPVPLTPMMANHMRQNMRDHLVAVQEIVRASAEDDYAGIQDAAEKIGSSPQMAQMCKHMGAGAEGFTEKALGFHETADHIVAAANKEDRDAVMAALGDTLETCTGCHTEYKQQIVSAEVWSQKTGMGAPTGAMQQMHHGGGE